MIKPIRDTRDPSKRKHRAYRAGRDVEKRGQRPGVLPSKSMDGGRKIVPEGIPLGKEGLARKHKVPLSAARTTQFDCSLSLSFSAVLNLEIVYAGDIAAVKQTTIIRRVRLDAIKFAVIARSVTRTKANGKQKTRDATRADGGEPLSFLSREFFVRADHHHATSVDARIFPRRNNNNRSFNSDASEVSSLSPSPDLNVSSSLTPRSRLYFARARARAAIMKPRSDDLQNQPSSSPFPVVCPAGRVSRRVSRGFIKCTN